MSAQRRPQPETAVAELIAMLTESKELRRSLFCALHAEIVLAQAVKDEEGLDKLLQAVSALAHLNMAAAIRAREAEQ